MTKILGLDLGTNSIGWAIRDTHLFENQITHKGAVIFPKGVGEEKNAEFSLAAERTKYRNSRKKYDRRKKRKARTLKVLIENNMCPLSLEELNLWIKYKKGQKSKYPESEDFRNWFRIDPYEVRAKAANQKVTPHELGRALYHLVQRRGFKSNRLENTDEKETGAVKEGIAALDQKMEAEGVQFYGELFHNLGQKREKAVGNGIKYPDPEEIKIRNHYTSREEYESEFRNICKVQELDKKLEKQLWEAIYYQRPLKSQKEGIGRCTFEKDKPRCPVSALPFEEFRARAYINHIKYKTHPDNDWQALDAEQRDEIYKLFLRKSRPTFEFGDISKKLTPRNESYIFNHKDHEKVTGSATTAQLKNVLGDLWERIPDESNLKGEISKDDLWHVLFTFDSKEKLKEFAQKHFELDDKAGENFSDIRLKQGYSKLSRKAINKILVYLREGAIYSYAALMANMKEAIGKNVWNQYSEDIKSNVWKIVDNERTNNRIRYTANVMIEGLRKYKEGEKGAQQDLSEVIHHVYGLEWDEYPQTEQNEIRNEIMQLYDQQKVKRGHTIEFLKIPRLDEKIKELLRKEYNVGVEGLDKLYHPSDIDIYEPAVQNEDGVFQLGDPAVGAFKNPMAMRTLRELKKLINYLLLSTDDSGNPLIDERTKVIVELARKLNDANKRKAIEWYNRDREKENDEYQERLVKDCGITIPTKTDILKYRLWEEQDHKCLYTGTEINICNLFGTNPDYDIEHTFPRSKSFDNSIANKTLSDVDYNRNVKKQNIPVDLPDYHEVLPRIEKWEKTIEELENTYNGLKAPRGYTETKDQKDYRITRKHYIKMQLDYWRDKVYRFKAKEIRGNFKNSQLTDTQLVTKYARAYLQSSFKKVYAVKGSVVNDAKEMWGLKPKDEKKVRDRHTHHIIDAVVIACLTKEVYDPLAEYYEKQEEGTKPDIEVPWGTRQTFYNDVMSIDNDALTKHIHRDNVSKYSRKKVRKRGKIQYKQDRNGNDLLDLRGKKIPLIISGDSVRGQLHKEMYYGKIKYLNEGDTEKSKWVEKSQSEDGGIFVIRKPLEYGERGFKTIAQLQNIVDPGVREKILNAVSYAGSVKEALSQTIWMNEDKKIPIKKVRCYASDVTSPLELKQHRDKSRPGQEYKQNIYVKNEDNYLMAIYQAEKNGKIKRDFELVNLLDAGDYYKASNTSYRTENPLYPSISTKGKLPFHRQLTKGDMVLFYDKETREVDKLIEARNKKELSKRLYKIIGFENDGRVLLRHHIVAEPDKNLGKGKSSVDFHEPHKKLRLSISNFNAQIEGQDFVFSAMGEIQKL